MPNLDNIYKTKLAASFQYPGKLPGILLSILDRPEGFLLTVAQTALDKSRPKNLRDWSSCVILRSIDNSRGNR